MGSKNRQLRSGYTTGACAAAAAKAAALVLLRNTADLEEVDIPFPDGSRVKFTVHRSELRTEQNGPVAAASVIKDAGDDPDITNGAEIRAEARTRERTAGILLKGGTGVGRATKPGLPVPVGEPAINPVPRRMIIAAVEESFADAGAQNPRLEITISIPNGEELAKKTLNHRLGIIGGLSILGTTGIVKPLSDAAWTATITASFDVAKALGLSEVVISTGRTSEKAHQTKYGLPVEAYAMMGDFTEFSLREASKHGFRRVHLCAQWAKMVKIAMGTPQTHVDHGALEANDARDFLAGLGLDIPTDSAFNTTREIFDLIRTTSRNPQAAFATVCSVARRYAEGVAEGVPVIMHLVSYEGDVIAESS